MGWNATRRGPAAAGGPRPASPDGDLLLLRAQLLPGPGARRGRGAVEPARRATFAVPSATTTCSAASFTPRRVRRLGSRCCAASSPPDLALPHPHAGISRHRSHGRLRGAPRTRAAREREGVRPRALGGGGAVRRRRRRPASTSSTWTPPSRAARPNGRTTARRSRASPRRRASRSRRAAGCASLDDCAALFDAGVRFAVLGTAAIKDPALVETACTRWPGRIVIAVDAREGKVAVEGWTETTGADALDDRRGGRAGRRGGRPLHRHRARRHARRSEPGCDGAARAPAAPLPRDRVGRRLAPGGSGRARADGCGRGRGGQGALREASSPSTRRSRACAR